MPKKFIKYKFTNAYLSEHIFKWNYQAQNITFCWGDFFFEINISGLRCWKPYVPKMCHSLDLTPGKKSLIEKSIKQTFKISKKFIAIQSEILRGFQKCQFQLDRTTSKWVMTGFRFFDISMLASFHCPIKPEVFIRISKPKYL